jgi:hypothetical protein
VLRIDVYQAQILAKRIGAVHSQGLLSDPGIVFQSKDSDKGRREQLCSSPISVFFATLKVIALCEFAQRMI